MKKLDEEDGSVEYGKRTVDREVTYLDLREFWESGYLQEVNRLFFHPLGLALELKFNSDGPIHLGGIWDYRDDPEGVLFSTLDREEDLIKAERVQKEFEKHKEARIALLGSVIQPIEQRN